MIVHTKVMQGIPKVIVADDDEDIGLSIRAALRLDGFEVWRTKSAEECLAKLEELQGNVDVFVINGSIASDRNASLILKIRRINPSAKILVIAERHQSEIKTRVMDYGADEFVLKPLSLDSVANKVTMLLSEIPTTSRK